MSRSEYVDMMVKKGFHFSAEVEEISSIQEKIKKKMGVINEKNEK